MYFVKFTQAKVVEFSDGAEFEKRARRFLLSRETENNYLLSVWPALIQNTLAAKTFTIEEEGAIIGAGGFLVEGRGLILTWMTHDAIEVLVDHAVNSKWNIAQVLGPGHTSFFFAREYAKRTGNQFLLDRAERVYQLAYITYRVPEEGKLQVATEEDIPLAQRWLQGFMKEAHYENDGRTAEQMTTQVIGARLLYFWKAPRAVSMAAWVCPTPNGASINYVYTPPELRGRGYAKAVTTALAGQMLASGLKYCAIRSDSDDPQTNAMYQSIGAHSLCEFVRCKIFPRVAENPAGQIAQSRSLTAS